jgi:hypothetical protein
MTPERQARLDTTMRLHDATWPWDESKSGRPAWPPTSLTFLECVFEEEDELEQRYGQCLPVRWTVTEAGGSSVSVGPFKTSIEASVQAIKIWVAAEVRFLAPFTYQRHDPQTLCPDEG